MNDFMYYLFYVFNNEQKIVKLEPNSEEWGLSDE